MKKDSYSGLYWMTEEIKNELIIRDKIVENEDIESLFSLKDNSDFSIALFEILQKKNEKEPNSLNEIELNLFLCMNLENAGQADSILSFLQEWFPEQNEKVIKSLNEIGASKSSEIIKKAIELLPENGTWFFESSNEESERIISELDSEFSNYPDGPMRNLYRKYAEKNRNEL
ncbi:DMP19 family protein [Tenacibaculum finnmarkense]|uniref:DMP19 family protein n=1 Tax=Tenacibaculum finnmarkense TaxID=2781243 RepID=UPI001E300122|nr:DMP19 family protein [Tenacibaculum finnmarkense]MCD8413694.1 DMP19 family protein [Tenacibaculum finnmarkense genomovar ulcerans]